MGIPNKSSCTESLIVKVFEMNKNIHYNTGIFIIITKVEKTEISGTSIWLERNKISCKFHDTKEVSRRER